MYMTMWRNFTWWSKKRFPVNSSKAKKRFTGRSEMTLTSNPKTEMHIICLHLFLVFGIYCTIYIYIYSLYINNLSILSHFPKAAMPIQGSRATWTWPAGLWWPDQDQSAQGSGSECPSCGGGSWPEGGGRSVVKGKKIYIGVMWNSAHILLFVFICQ